MSKCEILYLSGTTRNIFTFELGFLPDAYAGPSGGKRLPELIILNFDLSCHRLSWKEGVENAEATFPS
jgi:hypothetical protein